MLLSARCSFWPMASSMVLVVTLVPWSISPLGSTSAFVAALPLTPPTTNPINTFDNKQRHRLWGSTNDSLVTLPEISSVPKPILSGIKAVASDVDGTLTSPEGKVSARTKSTIKAIMDEGLVFFPATGKTRAGMYAVLGDQLGAELKAKDVPGVFIQGLIVYSGAGDDVLYERLLELDVIKAVTNFCRDRGMSVIAYSGDRIVCSKRDEQTDKITDYLEPTPEAIGSLEEAAAGGLPIHKLILMDTTENIDDVRPEVERLVGDVATLTQALSDMLEVLPLGASKGKGVAVLLEHLGIDPRHLMAMGDAENDVGMLQLAGIGVCMGNASPAAIAAADYVTLSNKENGAAVAMETLLGVITSKSK